eukprot:m.149350 g.149350  ORF g.149350 m.149350 type:complete len:170 (+) comp30652_c0_seq1:108-617(+)
MLTKEFNGGLYDTQQHHRHLTPTTDNNINTTTTSDKNTNTLTTSTALEHDPHDQRATLSPQPHCSDVLVVPVAVIVFTCRQLDTVLARCSFLLWVPSSDSQGEGSRVHQEEDTPPKAAPPSQTWWWQWFCKRTSGVVKDLMLTQVAHSHCHNHSRTYQSTASGLPLHNR